MRYVCVRFPDSFITIFVGARFQVFLLDNLFGAMINDPRVVFPRRFSKISIDRRPTPELIALPSNELSLRTKKLIITFVRKCLCRCCRRGVISSSPKSLR